MTAVADVMTRGVRSMTPEDPLIKAAQAMEELNVGAIPVCEGHRLVGMVTDRDIVVRGVARERDPRLCRLGDIMSEHVRTVREDSPYAGCRPPGPSRGHHHIGRHRSQDS